MCRQPCCLRHHSAFASSTTPVQHIEHDTLGTVHKVVQNVRPLAPAPRQRILLSGALSTCLAAIVRAIHHVDLPHPRPIAAFLLLAPPLHITSLHPAPCCKHVSNIRSDRTWIGARAVHHARLAHSRQVLAGGNCCECGAFRVRRTRLVRAGSRASTTFEAHPQQRLLLSCKGGVDNQSSIAHKRRTLRIPRSFETRQDTQECRRLARAIAHARINTRTIARARIEAHMSPWKNPK